jgi:hypothetical protein
MFKTECFTQNDVLNLPAGGTLVKQRFVRFSSGKLAYTAANGLALGVLYMDAVVDETVPVVKSGIVLVEVGSGGVTENTEVTGDATGKAIAVPAMTCTFPTNSTPVTSDGAHPVLTLAGGGFPVKIHGKALDTCVEGEFARILLG